MNVHRKRRTGGLAAAALLALAPGLRGDEQAVDVQAELKALRAEVAEVRAREGDSWLNQRRKEEIKALVHEVLADAETRASLQEGGLTAGYNKGFFLASEDGNFLLQFEGQSQTRYIYNSAEDNSDTEGEESQDESEGGFQQRRTKLGFKGHIFDPKLKYKIKGGFERQDGPFILEESYLDYAWADKHYVRIGQFKGRFLHEELVSSSKQIAVERSNLNEFFTLDYTQGVEIGGEYDAWNWSLVVHDGREVDNVDFANDATDIALAGRAELLLAGNWKQFGDFAAWSGDPFGLKVGAGFDYENGEGGSGSSTDFEHMIQYTADVQLKAQPFGFYAAYVGRMIEFDPGQGAPLDASEDDAHQWGVLAQGSVFVVPDTMDLFARYEYLDFDNVNEPVTSVSPLALPSGVEDAQHIFTFGTNYYFKKHDVKLTFDVLWAPEGVRRGESGGGTETSNAGDDDQFAVRGQFQFLF